MVCSWGLLSDLEVELAASELWRKYVYNHSLINLQTKTGQLNSSALETYRLKPERSETVSSANLNGREEWRADKNRLLGN